MPTPTADEAQAMEDLAISRHLAIALFEEMSDDDADIESVEAKLQVLHGLIAMRKARRRLSAPQPQAVWGPTSPRQ